MEVGDVYGWFSLYFKAGYLSATSYYDFCPAKFSKIFRERQNFAKTTRHPICGSEYRGVVAPTVFG